MNSTPYENQQDARPQGQVHNQQVAAGSYVPPPPAATPGMTRRKSAALATALSLMPGLGQVYVGYYQQGFINIIVVAGTIAVLASGMFRGLEPFLGIFLAFYWIFNMIDANRRAHHFNRVAAGLGGEDVPDEFELPSAGGSLFGGVVLVVLGILFILDLNFEVSMAWVQDWWPLLMVAFGVNLIYKARKKA